MTGKEAQNAMSKGWPLWLQRLGAAPGAGHYYNRIWVITVGCLIWGCMTLGFSMAPTIQAATLFWAVNGFGMSLAIPNVQVLLHTLVAHRCTCRRPPIASFAEPGEQGNIFVVFMLQSW